LVVGPDGPLAGGNTAGDVVAYPRGGEVRDASVVEGGARQRRKQMVAAQGGDYQHEPTIRRLLAWRCPYRNDPGKGLACGGGGSRGVVCRGGIGRRRPYLMTKLSTILRREAGSDRHFGYTLQVMMSDRGVERFLWWEF